MNIEFIKKQIYNLRDNSDKIQPGEHITAEAISILKDGRTIDRNACFAPTVSGETYTADIPCSGCQTILTQTTTKTNLMNYLDGRKQIFCNNCKEKLDLKRQEEILQRDLKIQEYNEAKNKKTEAYIKTYLDPNKYWNKDIPLWQRKNEILYASGIDYDTVAKHIQKMPYKDFLRTKYWTAISAYKKEKVGEKCALCGKTENLATHHASYKRHGYEHEHDVINKDLIALC